MAKMKYFLVRVRNNLQILLNMLESFLVMGGPKVRTIIPIDYYVLVSESRESRQRWRNIRVPT